MTEIETIAIRDFQELLDALPSWEQAAQEMREVLLSNLVMIGEVAAPTFGEERRVDFFRNRLTECGLQNCSTDEMGNGFGMLPGTEGEKTLLILAHADTLFGPEVDHTITVRPESVVGPGLGDNSLGVAVLATLPTLLERLGIRLRHNVLLMAASRSLGQGDLEGLRFFIANNRIPLEAAVCVEGVQLGRLSYKSIGMIRGECRVSVPEEYDWTRFGAAGAIVGLNGVMNRVLRIPRPTRPRTSIVFGSIEGGSGYSDIATNAGLRFEVRSESAEEVQSIWDKIEDIAAEVSSDSGSEISLRVVARRLPGGIEFSHPLVSCTRKILAALDIQDRIAPSTSELSAFIERRTPAITLGITYGKHLNKPHEELVIPSMFRGVAQLLGVVLAIDGGFCDAAG